VPIGNFGICKLTHRTRCKTRQIIIQKLKPEPCKRNTVKLRVPCTEEKQLMRENESKNESSYVGMLITGKTYIEI